MLLINLKMLQLLLMHYIIDYFLFCLLLYEYIIILYLKLKEHSIIIKK